MEHFEFDPIKSARNKKRHGVDLQWAQGLWDVTHIIIPAKDVIGESRCLILAKIGSKCYAAVFTRRRRGDQIDQLPQGGSPIGANL